MKPSSASLPELVIDGDRFEDLVGFFDEASRSLGTAPWGSNLDAFNDILRGGFGTPEGGFVLRWLHSERSAERLRWNETIRYIERKLTTCHSQNAPSVQADLEAARRGQGQTLFEILVEIIQDHGPGGDEAEQRALGPRVAVRGRPPSWSRRGRSDRPWPFGGPRAHEDVLGSCLTVPMTCVEPQLSSCMTFVHFASSEVLMKSGRHLVAHTARLSGHGEVRGRHVRLDAHARGLPRRT